MDWGYQTYLSNFNLPKLHTDNVKIKKFRGDTVQNYWHLVFKQTLTLYKYCWLSSSVVMKLSSVIKVYYPTANLKNPSIHIYKKMTFPIVPLKENLKKSLKQVVMWMFQCKNIQLLKLIFPCTVNAYVKLSYFAHKFQ